MEQFQVIFTQDWWTNNTLNPMHCLVIFVVVMLFFAVCEFFISKFWE